MAKILAHMPIRKYISDVINAFLRIDKGLHEVNYLISAYDLNSNPMQGRSVTMEGRKNIVYKMETAKRIATNEGYDYLFNVEDDNIIPPNALLDLLTSGKDLISGIYRYRPSKKPNSPLMAEAITKANFADSDLDKGVLPAHLIPWGCTLFARNVFMKMPFTVGLDGDYITECEKKGIKRWVNMGVKVGHIDVAKDGSMVEIKI